MFRSFFGGGAAARVAAQRALPGGWRAVPSSSGGTSYENLFTGERVAWTPKYPAAFEAGESPDLYEGPRRPSVRDSHRAADIEAPAPEPAAERKEEKSPAGFGGVRESVWRHFYDEDIEEEAHREEELLEAATAQAEEEAAPAREIGVGGLARAKVGAARARRRASEAAFAANLANAEVVEAAPARADVHGGRRVSSSGAAPGPRMSQPLPPSNDLQRRASVAAARRASAVAARRASRKGSALRKTGAAASVPPRPSMAVEPRAAAAQQQQQQRRGSRRGSRRPSAAAAGAAAAAGGPHQGRHFDEHGRPTFWTAVADSARNAARRGAKLPNVRMSHPMMQAALRAKVKHEAERKERHAKHHGKHHSSKKKKKKKRKKKGKGWRALGNALSSAVGRKKKGKKKKAKSRRHHRSHRSRRHMSTASALSSAGSVASMTSVPSETSGKVLGVAGGNDYSHWRRPSTKRVPPRPSQAVAARRTSMPAAVPTHEVQLYH